MAMTRRPGKSADKGADKSKNLPPWLQKSAKSPKAPAKGAKGGRNPKSSNPFAKK